MMVGKRQSTTPRASCLRHSFDIWLSTFDIVRAARMVRLRGEDAAGRHPTFVILSTFDFRHSAWPARHGRPQRADGVALGGIFRGTYLRTTRARQAIMTHGAEKGTVNQRASRDRGACLIVR
jgi:hypothetical protein